jgi:hypothetical protein
MFLVANARSSVTRKVNESEPRALASGIGAHFKKGGIFLALKGLYIPAQGNALGKF